MKIMLFGASGMVGQGVLRECLHSPKVTEVVAVGRTAVPGDSGKLRQVLRPDLFDLTGLEAEFQAVDACLFCVGITSFRTDKDAYRRTTHDLPLYVAQRFVDLNREIAFVHVSAAGADPTGRGMAAWARVKGATENGLLQLPLREVTVFRPGLIVPLHGIRSRTAVYRWIYAALTPVLPGLQRLLPSHVTSTEQLARAMLRVASSGSSKRVLESTDINGL